MSNRILGPSNGLESLHSAVESEFARTRESRNSETQSAATEKLGAAGARSSSKKAKGEDLAKAAHEFESLLLAQMLRTVRESGNGSGWLGSGKAMGADSTMELAEGQLAKALADRGALGLSQMLQCEMTRESQGDPDTSPADAAGAIRGGQSPRFAPLSLDEPRK